MADQGGGFLGKTGEKIQEIAANADKAPPADAAGGTQAAPPGTAPGFQVDPNAISSSTGSTPEDIWISQVVQMYLRVWGVPPSQQWIDQAKNSGMNVYELEQSERSKPAFNSTQPYADEASRYAQLLASIFGTGRTG